MCAHKHKRKPCLRLYYENINQVLVDDLILRKHFKVTGMDKLSFKLERATKSLTSLHEIFSETYSSVVRDATLFRFKRSVEIFMRLLKD